MELEGKIDSVWVLVPVCVWGQAYKARVQEGECIANIMYSCMKIEK
jgi:hypothetical protein